MALQSTIEARNQPQLQLGLACGTFTAAFWSREAARDTTGVKAKEIWQMKTLLRFCASTA